MASVSYHTCAFFHAVAENGDLTKETKEELLQQTASTIVNWVKNNSHVFQSIKKLDLSRCTELRYIPDEIQHFSKLEALDISGSPHVIISDKAGKKNSSRTLSIIVPDQKTDSEHLDDDTEKNYAIITRSVYGKTNFFVTREPKSEEEQLRQAQQKYDDSKLIYCEFLNDWMTTEELDRTYGGL